MGNTTSPAALGALIRRAREDKGLTQKELAVALKLDATPAISRWEKGAAPVPPIHFKLLATALGVPLKTILAAAPADDVKKFRLMELRTTSGKGSARGPRGKEELDTPLARHPALLQGFQRLHEQYPDFSIPRLIDNACNYFLKQAEEYGLNGHGVPFTPRGSDPPHPPAGLTDQKSGRSPVKAANCR
jgi:transcriptional regulator with XRE-family HTH domain